MSVTLFCRDAFEVLKEFEVPAVSAVSIVSEEPKFAREPELSSVLLHLTDDGMLLRLTIHTRATRAVESREKKCVILVNGFIFGGFPEAGRSHGMNFAAECTARYMYVHMAPFYMYEAKLHVPLQFLRMSLRTCTSTARINPVASMVVSINGLEIEEYTRISTVVTGQFQDCAFR